MDNWETTDALEPIAIIGMSGQFPGAKNVEQFWQNLCDGIESISFFTDEELLATGVDPALLRNPNYVKANAVLADIEMFDASFFGFTPREAKAMDPQHRLLLECAWNTLETAGYDPKTYDGRIGIYAGANLSTYLYRNLVSNPDLLTDVDFDLIQQQDPISLGNDRDYLTTRISYKLGLNGPSINVNTACSTSLVAVHLASQSLLNYQCDMALAGAVSIQVPQKAGYLYREGGIASPDGHCRTFDAKAQGTLFCSGLGLVLLKRLEDALEDGDYIYAVIKGSAINNDGASKVSYTAPSVDGQAAAIAEAQAVAEVAPETISYIEAHGTGTALGDPIEIAALTQVFRASTDKKGFCGIGSVKPNVGHLNRAAGMAGLVKTVLAIKHKLIPPSINYEQPNPQIDFANSPFYVNTTLREWQTNGMPRLAGISSLGFGGTNAHAVLAEAPETEISSPSRPWQLLLISAKTDAALDTATQNLAEHLKQHPEINLADVAYTLQVGRRAFNHRRMLVCRNLDEALTALENPDLPGFLTKSLEFSERPVVFMFSGQGSQYVNMALELYQVERAFREQVDLCADILQPHLELDLRHVLYPTEEQADEALTQLKQTAITQPALFVIEYALAKLWESWGVRPQAMIGHSIGEYVAACLAGVFSLEDALSLVAARGKMMQQLPQGAMLAVPLSEEEVQPFLGQGISLALINGTSRCVMSGTTDAVEALEKQLAGQGIEGRRLHTSHAFHSEMMEPILEPFIERVKQVTLKPPQIPYVSNVTGTWITAEEATDPNYWARHLRQTVRFSSGLQQLFQESEQLLLEVGPGRTLSTLALQHPDKAVEQVVLTSVRHPKQTQSDLAFLLNTLGKLWGAGVEVDWSGFYANERRHRLPLPTYPFERKRYWVEANEASNYKKRLLSSTDSRTLHPLLGQQLHLAGTQEIRFESQISQDLPAFLKHHCVYQTTILPATAYIEMALAAGVVVFKSENLVLEEVLIQRALILPEDEVKTLQVILTSEGTLAYSFQIFSLITDEDDSESSWTLHASGKIIVDNPEQEPARAELTALQNNITEEISIEDYYQQFQEYSMDYGSSFQAIEQLWRHEGEALGQIRLPEALVLDAGDYKLHPVLLDACFQVLVTAIPEAGKDKPWVPVSLDRLQVYRRPSNCLWSHAQIRSVKDSNHQTISSEVHLFTPDGQLIAEVEGLLLKKASREALLGNKQESLQNWFYQIEWLPMAHMAQVKSESSRAESEQKKWLIFADGQGIGQELGRLLQSKGEGCIFVFPGKDYQKLSEQEFRIDPASKADFQQLLKAVGVNQTSLHGVVHLWSLDAVEAGTLTSTNLEEASKQGCGSTLHLVQSLCEFSALPSLWLITQGAVPAGEKPNVPGVAQSALWGMGKVIALEHPELNCVRVDLDPDDQRNQAQALFEEIWLETTEDEVAFRDQSRHVARLMPISRTKESLVQDRLEVPHSQSFQLGTSDRGILENLELQPTTRCQPSGDEVEIQVYATGLNFRDVLSALGLYPGDPGLFGCECAGKVVAIGEDVEGFEIGESVVAIAPGGFSKYVTVKADLVVSKPESLSFEEAATIPVAFLTAYYTLHHLANISPGDRVLIHAATGGVGQAAVQLAQQAGAEVLGTASPAKWEFLKSLGVKHIMNSRTLDFAEEVMAITEGQGVDIVLNSLSGEFIPKSLSVLSAEGRFLEIGKRGVWDASQVSQVKPRASYFLVDLMQVSQHQPALVQPMLRQLMQQFQEGKLKPLAQKVFPIQEAVSAFRYMQQAKHIGKIVVSQGLEIVNLAEQKPITFERNSTYLITGGTGGLGLLMARWMVEKGARHLILVGRSGASSAISSQLRELEQAGAEVVVAKADVSEVEQVAQVFKEIMQSQPPLRGIIHAAGILDDGLLMQLSWERFYRVMAAKVEGAWNLHKLTQDLPLDFFVCFSSITSLLGNMGQGNYAAANAFLDALAYHRRAIGLPGLTINWGPWADVGMAANMGHSEQSRLADRGLGRISPEQGLQVLAELLTQVATQVGAVPLNWQKFLQQFSAGSYPALFSDFAAKIQQQEKLQQTLVQPTNLLEQLEKATPDERRKLLVKYLQQQVKKLLGFDASSPLEPNQLLSELGLDSLVSIQLRNRIRTQLKVDLPIDQFLESTIVQLGNSLLEKLALANIILSEAPSTDLGEDMEEITL